LLIPAAARIYVPHCDQGLSAHGKKYTAHKLLF
jgi:hypothetical protein